MARSMAIVNSGRSLWDVITFAIELAYLNYELRPSIASRTRVTESLD